MRIFQDYWDGEGSNGGKTKPKFFQAHSLTDSLIEQLTILNPPVQVFSIYSASSLELAYISPSSLLCEISSQDDLVLMNPYSHSH